MSLKGMGGRMMGSINSGHKNGERLSLEQIQAFFRPSERLQI